MFLLFEVKLESYFTFKRIASMIIILKAMLILYLVMSILTHHGSWQVNIDARFLIFIIVGFVAQIIDGTLGMAYGVSCTTILLNLGIPPAVASAAVHTSEVFTTGVSGLSHLYMKNVDKKLFIKLVLPGVIGSMLGAYILSEQVDGNIIKPYIAGYLLIMGVVIIIKSFQLIKPKEHVKHVSTLGLTGGFMDAVGGGGWGPIVTSNIVVQGKSPKETVGTVNTVEFFVAFFSTGVFLFFVGIKSWNIILALIIGGIIAAPLAAFFTTKINARVLMFLVGSLIIITSLLTLAKTFSLI
jgi:hypothetical protein